MPENMNAKSMSFIHVIDVSQTGLIYLEYSFDNFLSFLLCNIVRNLKHFFETKGKTLLDSMTPGNLILK